MSWRAAFGALCAVVCVACDTATEPVILDVDLARERWLAARPAAYQVEMAVTTSWSFKSPYYTAIVSGDTLLSVRDESGEQVRTAWVISVDSLWNRIMSERAAGRLNSATFSQRGVPLEADWGPWPVDGGVRYSLRGFRRR